MGGCYTFLLFICITHFFTVNGQQVPPPARPKNQDCPPPRPPRPLTPTPKLKSKLAPIYPVIQALKEKVGVDPKGITKTWKGLNICQDYKGFSCNHMVLSAVNFNDFNLGGRNLTLTEFLTNLPDIVSFHANSNNFTGSIPTGINKLRHLKDLDLSNNNFSGDFPYEVLRGHKLRVLDLRYNTFAGIIPPQVFLLNLTYLFINNNNFTQKLPDNLGLTKVNYLNLANNKFIGGIPPSIGQANNTLLEVLFLNNHLNGCLPYEIGLLKKANLFDVESNYLTGPIPLSFQCLKKMNVLNLARNKFYGVVPEAVCSLPELLNFTLSYNYFTQVGPQCRELIKIGVVDMKMNCISDLPNQRPLADCDKFFSRNHSCANEKSLTNVPCAGVYSHAWSEYSAGIQLTARQAPPGRIYKSLFRHYVVYN